MLHIKPVLHLRNSKWNVNPGFLVQFLEPASYKHVKRLTAWQHYHSLKARGKPKDDKRKTVLCLIVIQCPPIRFSIFQLDGTKIQSPPFKSTSSEDRPATENFDWPSTRHFSWCVGGGRAPSWNQDTFVWYSELHKNYHLHSSSYLVAMQVLTCLPLSYLVM